jgi:hypothetical protein
VDERDLIAAAGMFSAALLHNKTLHTFAHTSANPAQLQTAVQSNYSIITCVAGLDFAGPLLYNRVSTAQEPLGPAYSA